MHDSFVETVELAGSTNGVGPHVGPAQPITNTQVLGGQQGAFAHLVDGVAGGTPDGARFSGYVSRVADPLTVEREELGVNLLMVEHDAIEGAIDTIVDIICCVLWREMNTE